MTRLSLLRFALPLFAMLAAGCASNAVRYVDASGKTHDGTIDPLTNTMTANIDGKTYRGPYRVNEWAQAKSTLAGPKGETLYCDFLYDVLKVKGTCTDLAGGDYRVQSR